MTDTVTPNSDAVARHRVCQVTVASGQRFDVNKDDLLLKAAIEQGIEYPHNCRVGVCGACKTRLLRGKVSPMVDLALSPLTNDQLKEGYFLACQAKVRTDIEIDVKLGQHQQLPVETVSARVSMWRRRPGDVIELRLKLDTPLRFHAGQYATIAESGSFIRRHYSIYDAPAEGDTPASEIGFLVKRLPGGRFSEWLFEADRTGMKFWVEGPFGMMEVDEPDRDVLCVAGGTGLAPILSIVGDRLRKSSTARCTIVFGVRRSGDQFAQEHLQRLTAMAPDRVRVVTVLSHEPKGSNWNGPRGLVTDVLGPELGIDFCQVLSFTCGNLAMVDAVENRLAALGVRPDRMHADRFVPSGT